jgi:hypothetical protein
VHQARRPVAPLDSDCIVAHIWYYTGMAAKSNTKEKSAAQNSRGLRFELRFIDQAHLDLVERAKQHTGATSMNSWIAQATLAEARRQLAAK